MSRAALSIIALVALAISGVAGAHAQVAAGAAVFEEKCSMCHVAEGGGQGPSLVGVVGRKAGSAAGFEYTYALQGSGLVWTAAQLDRFLTDPGRAVPGTAMLVTVPDPKQRRDLIAYLASQGGARKAP